VVLRWFPNWLKPLSKGYTLFTTANFDFSHQRSNSMQDDDEATPPPAKRAHEYSDADQASIANVSTSGKLVLALLDLNGSKCK
jgi:hypothetical protein